MFGWIYHLVVTQIANETDKQWLSYMFGMTSTPWFSSVLFFFVSEKKKQTGFFTSKIALRGGFGTLKARVETNFSRHHVWRAFGYIAFWEDSVSVETCYWIWGPPCFLVWADVAWRIGFCQDVFKFGDKAIKWTGGKVFAYVKSLNPWQSYMFTLTKLPFKGKKGLKKWRRS